MNAHFTYERTGGTNLLTSVGPGAVVVASSAADGTARTNKPPWSMGRSWRVVNLTYVVRELGPRGWLI
jgi:hypothetical protein